MRQRRDETAIAEGFGRANPIGTRCRYYPKFPCGEDEFEVCVIESEPWVLGHGAAVVKISTRSGGVSVMHLFPIGLEPTS